MICHELCLCRDALLLQKVRQLMDVVIKTRQLNDNAASILRQHEDLVVNQIAGLIGIKRNAVFSINIHAPLVQHHGTFSNLVHRKYLQNVLYLKACIFLSLVLSWRCKDDS